VRETERADLALRGAGEAGDPAVGEARRRTAGSVRAARRISGSNATISRMFSRNHGSILVRASISAVPRPARYASPMAKIRSGFGTRRRALRSSSDSGRSSESPKRSCSSERTAFWSASLNVRPMAMTSPTDFICVVRVRSASGNFSKAQRGNFTTQ
jgi:hypothetical protein